MKSFRLIIGTCFLFSIFAHAKLSNTREEIRDFNQRLKAKLGIEAATLNIGKVLRNDVERLAATEFPRKEYPQECYAIFNWPYGFDDAPRVSIDSWDLYQWLPGAPLQLHRSRQFFDPLLPDQPCRIEGNILSCEAVDCVTEEGFENCRIPAARFEIAESGVKVNNSICHKR